MHIAYLGLGSNLGDRRHVMSETIKRINELIGDVLSRSAFYETEPWGFVSDNTFLNAAVCVRTALSPFQLLEATQDIEWEMGRTTKSEAGVYHDRVIDIDILLYDDLNISTPELTVPHPLMHEREFVMKPLGEILDKEKDGAKKEIREDKVR